MNPQDPFKPFCTAHPLDGSSFQTLVRAFRLYKQLYNGSMSIPAKWTVPNITIWPVELWGLPLGRRAVDIRSKKLYQHDQYKHDTLDSLGFIWDPKSYNFNYTIQGLSLYAAQYTGRYLVSLSVSFIFSFSYILAFSCPFYLTRIYIFCFALYFAMCVTT